MSVRLETISAKYSSVHIVKEGEEVIEDYGDTVLESEIAVVISGDEAYSIQGTKADVRGLLEQALAQLDKA